MITQEQIEINGKEFLHTYSDTYMLKQVETGVLYIEALDLIPCQYTYVESEELLPVEEPIEGVEQNGLIIEDSI